MLVRLVRKSTRQRAMTATVDGKFNSEEELLLFLIGSYQQRHKQSDPEQAYEQSIATVRLLLLNVIEDIEDERKYSARP